MNAIPGNGKALYILSTLIIVLTITVSGIGLMDSTGGNTYEYANQYGDVVKIYGKGLYRNDSYFKAPIFRGSDLTILAIACPLLIVALYLDARSKTMKTRMALTGLIALITYYAASIAFGVVYNKLHLVYIALFSASFFALILCMMSVDFNTAEGPVKESLPYTVVYIFLILTGIALIVAWLPDIIGAIVKKRPLALIENYTTEITFVLDMGIIAPLCFLCVYLLKQRRMMGYVLLEILLTLCILIGIMLPVQTWFQLAAGIEMPFPVLVTKVGSFCVLALFAGYFKTRLRWV